MTKQEFEELCDKSVVAAMECHKLDKVLKLSDVRALYDQLTAPKLDVEVDHCYVPRVWWEELRGYVETWIRDAAIDKVRDNYRYERNRGRVNASLQMLDKMGEIEQRGEGV